MTVPSSSDSVTVLSGMYAAEAEYLASGGPGAASFCLLAPFFAPDVVLHQADALPYGGTWRGHQGMEEFFLAMSQVWESFDMVEQDFLATGETAVVLTQVRARARSTGRELSFLILQTIRIKDEKIVEVRPFYWDTEAIASACAAVAASERRSL
ncbi:nuclear transport factor 2 family protein [Streptomyces sp. SID14478]|uniref:nuclear transport factor 2 family protein n=1 Tax=Streptomyces sp. SID14478 TaxID=2706073 RepID=UPI0013DFA092|nr:nuclear transport factor 2 family protein [Streptomyces sp. SID14478]NEB80441.1 nuclear transport factor 2 family protein [Streptomyces sp. SID14478]